MYELCRHIKTDGIKCDSPAIKNTLFCFNHTQTRKLTRRRRRSPNDFNFSIPFVFPEDRVSLQTNYFLVLQALAEGKIDNQTSNSMTRNLRACGVNLAKGPLVASDPENAVQRVILTPDGEEIAPPREALEKDEALAHGPACPCRKCAEQYRNAPPELHHHDCNCGLCEHTTNTDPVEPSMLNPEIDSPAGGRASFMEASDFNLRSADKKNKLDRFEEAHLSAKGLSAVANGVPTDRSSSVGWVDEASAILEQQTHAIADQHHAPHEASQREAHSGRQPGKFNSPDASPHLAAAGTSAGEPGSPWTGLRPWGGEPERVVEASAAWTASPAPKAATAARLCEKEPTPPATKNDEKDENDSLYDYESVRQIYWARQAAMEAGQEPPPWPSDAAKKTEPDTPKPEPYHVRRYNEIMEQVEKNKKIAEEIWRRRFPDQAAKQDAENNAGQQPIASA